MSMNAIFVLEPGVPSLLSLLVTPLAAILLACPICYKPIGSKEDALLIFFAIRGQKIANVAGDLDPQP